ncbi:MAG: bifunctional UDP-N-acetylglucosamine diphosphorylase/glucosamine-1-phosphate N-acetyltransferase GlmU [Bdellovibrionales bacterium]|nr:bifunctional UDP-N-acetylglucosamine diphosphorylase/glucosamine-1-phosphate N-acetyltransferase GlmU [Bdellovibrionales bacterium]
MSRTVSAPSGGLPGLVVLAAGHGKRMRSSLPKVLSSIAGRPLLHHILDRVIAAVPGAPIAVVVGHRKEDVIASVRAEERFAKLGIEFIDQGDPRGTGHAVQCVMATAWGKKFARPRGAVMVLPGDLPLIRAEMVSELAKPLGRIDALRLLTTELPDPTGYGRVIRKGRGGPVQRIVEERDADTRQKTVREVACSIYLFDGAFLDKGLGLLDTKNSQGEFYLTDLVQIARKQRRNVAVLAWADEVDLRGINDPWELALAARSYNRRLLKRWAVEGVRFQNPDNTFVDEGVTLSEGVEVGTGCVLSGKTSVGKGVKLGANVILADVVVEAGAVIKAGTVCEKSHISAGASVGPYAHLRPDSHVGPEAKLGNFVELKNTRIGAKTAVSHLSYLGDADVGSRANIGCGFVTCNYDGRVIDGKRKHSTIIEDDVFMGSDCQTVAPVKVGKGAYVASGSTITENVEADALAIARSRQVNKPGYAKKLREQK